MEVAEKGQYNKVNDFIYLIFIFIVLGYLELFSINLFPTEIRSLAQLVGGGITVLVLLFKTIYFREEQIHKHFAYPVILLLSGFFLSSLIAYFYYKQPIILSFWVKNIMLYYFLYFLLHAFRFGKKEIEKVIFGIGFLTIFFFYVQTVLYPVQLFDARMGIDRGTLRLFLPGMGFIIFIYFYYLNKFFKEKKTLYIVIVLLCYSVYILQATRQIIASIAVLTIFNILISRQLKSKFLVLLMVVIGVGFLFIIFQDLFIEMFSVSMKQSGSVTESVRINAIKYFFRELFPTKITYLLGNGPPYGGTSYGVYINLVKEFNGFYLSDIGIIGDYIMYGAIFIVGSILVLVKAFTLKLDPEYEYLRYFVMYAMFTLFTGRGTFGTASIDLILIMYLMDLGNREYKKVKDSRHTNDAFTA